MSSAVGVTGENKQGVRESTGCVADIVPSVAGV
eukprot:CAMPEP_0185839412 /NCGR_PEP_ID=MMETSP1353-20130828/14541_1 /TAXON_ID=1077150 /ORGANISM="Erythrolobus australicus, Strain CCMP3124" /LENGTH=32 /DNA_ID= /DNA_START= /DNA_END= /DNA_ORIENTATION=